MRQDRGTQFTVFAIPVSEIRSTEPVGPKLNGFLRQAVQAAGYTVLSDDEVAGRALPRLRAQVKKFWFITYMWFWPLVVGGGDCNVHVKLEDPQGNLLWEDTFKQYASVSGMGNVGSEDLGAVTRKATTGCLDKLVEAMASDEFRAALGHKTTARQSQK